EVHVPDVSGAWHSFAVVGRAQTGPRRPRASRPGRGEEVARRGPAAAARGRQETAGAGLAAGRRGGAGGTCRPGAGGSGNRSEGRGPHLARRGTVAGDRRALGPDRGGGEGQEAARRTEGRRETAAPGR